MKNEFQYHKRSFNFRFKPNIVDILCMAAILFCVGMMFGKASGIKEALNSYPQLIHIEGITVETSNIVSKDMVRQEIAKQARDTYADLGTVMRIANCESGFNSYAANATSTAKGVYQFLDGTWDYIDADGHQFDYKENIKQFMIWYPSHPEWWSECR